MWEPDNYKNDPYGYLTNQIGHMYFGFFAVTLLSFVIDLLLGFPYQTISVFVVLILYAVCWEYLYQGWNGWDTLEDTFYVGLGSIPFMVYNIEPILNSLMLFFLIANTLLLVGYIKRWNRNQKK